MEPMPPAVEVLSPNHWITREVPGVQFYLALEFYWRLTLFSVQTALYSLARLCLELKSHSENMWSYLNRQEHLSSVIYEKQIELYTELHWKGKLDTVHYFFFFGYWKSDRITTVMFEELNYKLYLEKYMGININEYCDKRAMMEGMKEISSIRY